MLNCASEIDQWCSPRGDIEAEGRTLHCLMEHAQTRNETIKIGDKCMQALGQVIKVGRQITVVDKSSACVLDCNVNATN